MYGLKKPDEKQLTALNFYKLEGVRDLRPMAVRGHFSKALAIEANAGKTTPEAEKELDLALKVEELSAAASSV